MEFYRRKDTIRMEKSMVFGEVIQFRDVHQV